MQNDDSTLIFPTQAVNSALFTGDDVFIRLGSNLVLANREARLRTPSGEDLSEQNAWAVLRTATEMVGQISKSQILVPSEGIEPPYAP